MADLNATFIDDPLDVVYGEALDALRDFDASLIELPSGGGATVVYYDMRAWNTNLLEYVYWRSSGSPDFTGAGSGYPPVDLAFIVVQVAPRA